MSNKPPFCRCNESSVAHVRGCFEGWGEPVTKLNECCERCKRISHGDKEVGIRDLFFCINSSCVCHTTEDRGDWEKEFDKLFFPRGDDFTSKLLSDYNDATKSFIQKQIQTTREEGKAEGYQKALGAVREELKDFEEHGEYPINIILSILDELKKKL